MEMKKSQHHHALKAAHKKMITLANQFFDDGRDLSEIASELNSRRFRQNDGKRFNWKSISDLIDDKNFKA
jgi:hypothetical protein